MMQGDKNMRVEVFHSYLLPQEANNYVYLLMRLQE